MIDAVSEKADFATEFIDLSQATGLDDVWWEDFQLEFLNNPGRFGIDVKSRQIAWSFTAAVDAVVDGVLNPGNPHIFTSINQDEAKEKIRYTRQILEALDLPPSDRPRLVRDSQTEIELADGTRFISHPCRPPRGKPNARIYLDEFGHYPEGMDREVYRAALPATSKGSGYIRVGSSPMGASGLFWEIFTQTMREYPGFVRGFYPWWEMRAFCHDPERARVEAPTMQTHERVYTFGTAAIIDIFENMFLEDFQQEYECEWVDEASAWIDWELIARNQRAFSDADMLYWKAESVDQALAMLDGIKEAIERKQIEPVLAAGIDIGRKRNTTELIAVGKSTTGQLPTRIMITLDRVEFDDQQRCFEQVIAALPFTSVLIDQNGIGMQLAENLNRRFRQRVQPAEFTNPNKELWAVEARVQAERVNVPLPPDRDLAYQIHSIKKKTTAAKHNTYDTEANEKHHADKFWAWALAVYAASSTVQPAVRRVAVQGLYKNRSRGRR